MNFDSKIKLGLALLVNQTVLQAATPTKSDSQRPNIVFIEVDDLNYEYLSCFGSKLVKTPNVDNFAQNGVRFTNAFAQGMMSGPSRNSLITGMYAHNMGFYQNGDMKSLPDGVWTFPKALQRAGYYSSWVGKCHIRPFMATRDKTEAMRTQMGFDFVQQTMGRTVLGGAEYGEEESAAKKAKKNAADTPENIKKAQRKQQIQAADWYMSSLKKTGYEEQFLKEFPNTSTLPEDVYLDGFFSKSAEDFIKGYKSEKPLFMWINYSVPHGPYDVAEEYHKPFSADKMPGFTTTNYVTPPNLIKRTKSFKSEAEAKKEQAGIAASVSFMDRQVGRIIKQLKDKGLYDNTIIVFFSDQGLMAGDHHLIHKSTLFRQITNPALIISYPKGFEKNKTVNSPVELRDLVNTVLEISNANTADKSYHSTSYSLLPLLQAKADKVRDYAFAEIEDYICVSDGKYRYIEGVDAQLLFDDEKDPKNLNNIAAASPEIVKKLSSEIAKWKLNSGKFLPSKSM
jgi:arylsulfatase A-like enzyme